MWHPMLKMVNHPELVLEWKSRDATVESLRSDGWELPKVGWEAGLPGSPELFVLPQGWVVASAGGRLAAGTRSRPPHMSAWSAGLQVMCTQKSPVPPEPRSRGFPRSSGNRFPLLWCRFLSQNYNKKCVNILTGKCQLTGRELLHDHGNSTE